MQDPILSSVKLIAEPWDLGPNGYQVGKFPALWTEWNGKYRDCIRRFWKGESDLISELALRIAGSPDLYESRGKRPQAGINFVTAHDGFTLRDLVSYNVKHNETNLEDNKDGLDENFTWNCGHEGDTDDKNILALRKKQMKNLIATLFFSQGVPMLCAGDELSIAKNGNNNSYCQDNELNWLNWDLNDVQKEFLQFLIACSEIRKANPVLRRQNFISKHKINREDVKDIIFFKPSGKKIAAQGRISTADKSFGILLSGELINAFDERGISISGDTLFLAINADTQDIDFRLPLSMNRIWELMVEPGSRKTSPHIHSEGTLYNLERNSLSLFRMIGKESADIPTKGLKL